MKHAKTLPTSHERFANRCDIYTPIQTGGGNSVESRPQKQYSEKYWYVVVTFQEQGHAVTRDEVG